MKKYMLLLLLLIPTIAFAGTCSEDFETLRQNITTRYNNLSYGGCDRVTTVGDNYQNNVCLQSFNSLEQTFDKAMEKYNACSNSDGAKAFYNYIYDYVIKYNALPSKRNFNFYSRSTCGEEMTKHLATLENNKNSLTNLVVSRGCGENTANTECKQAFDSYKNKLSLSYTIETNYKYSSCDIIAFHDQWYKYVDAYNQIAHANYNPSSFNDNTCMQSVNQALETLDKYKTQIIENQCDTDAALYNKECKQPIENFQTVLKNVYSKKRAGDFKSCSDYTNFDKRLSAFEYYYNRLPYVVENQMSFEPPEPKVKEVKKEKVFCPLGDDVTKDLVGVLRIMKIVAPILVFVYTLYETIKALTKGEMESESKKLFQKFAKRVGAAILLFAIPVLIDALMQMFNVWDNTGRCVLTDVETEEVTTTQTN